MTSLEWFCCLNLAERSAVRVCVDSYILTAGTFIPETLFNVPWLFALDYRDERKAAFVSGFYLHKTEIVPGEGLEPISAYVFTQPALWIPLVAYCLSPSGACGDGCSKRFYP